jgi:hypothetical protein
MLEYIRHLEELQIVSMIGENSGLYSFELVSCNTLRTCFWNFGGMIMHEYGGPLTP